MSASVLCLNMRREHTVGDACTNDASAAIANARSVLGHARTHGMRILHVFTPSQRDSARGAIPGLEPLRDEEVIALRHISVFDDPTLTSIQNAYFLGGVFSRSGLANTLGALDRKVSLMLIVDACWPLEGEAIDANEILSLAQRAGAGTLSLVRTAGVIGDQAANVVELGAWLR